MILPPLCRVPFNQQPAIWMKTAIKGVVVLLMFWLIQWLSLFWWSTPSTFGDSFESIILSEVAQLLGYSYVFGSIEGVVFVALLFMSIPIIAILSWEIWRQKNR